MGTFVGHMVPGLALTFLGLWHTFNTIKAYHLNGKSKFSSRLWHPFHSPIFNFKYLELVLILSFTIFAITVQILDFSLLKFTFELANFEHATMFLHLAIYASITLLVELTPSPEIFTGLVGVLTASVFSQELFLLHFHSTDHVSLEGHYHWLLQIIVLVSFISVVGVTTCPNCFVAALTLSISVVFQGCWLMNMGFMLWVPSFVPKGCIVTLADGLHDMHGAVMCETDEVFHRAIALANLQFSWILAGNLILVACLCLTLSRKCFQRNQFIDYEQLQCNYLASGTWRQNRQLFSKWNMEAKYIIKRPLKCKWKKPNAGWYKVNSDGSLQGTKGGYGAVIRDDTGAVVAACSGATNGQSVIKHELQGIEVGLKLARLHHLMKLDISTDSTTVLEYLTKDMNSAWNPRHIIRRIKSMLGQLEQYKISHDYRETNRIADKLASLLPNAEFIEIIPSSFAEDLKDIVQEDRIGKTYLRL